MKKLLLAAKLGRQEELILKKGGEPYCNNSDVKYFLSPRADHRPSITDMCPLH